MNKAIPALTLLCGFLMGVIAGPWLWPRDLRAPVTVPDTAPESNTQVQPQLSLPEPISAAPAPEAAQEQPEWILKGVLVGEDASRSRALIARGVDEPRLYKVDDKLPDGSVVKAVDYKHVELEKDGETLNLTLDRGRPSPETEPAPANVDETPAETPADTTEKPAPSPVTANAGTGASE